MSQALTVAENALHSGDPIKIYEADLLEPLRKYYLSQV